MKLKSISILPLIISILAGEGITGVNDENVDEYVSSSPQEVTRFIENNFSKVVLEYNKVSTDKWNAAYIEDKFEILIDDTENIYTGMFLDFDSDHGYAVIGNNYQFVDFNVSDESPYLGIETENHFYSTTSGYMYLANGEYLSVKDENNASEDSLAAKVNGTSYNGQESGQTGCGKILNADLYVNDKYGGGWSLYMQRSLPMTGYHQGDLSCYNTISYDSKEKKYNSVSEANCWFIGPYHVVQYMSQKKWPKLPQDTSIKSYIPKDDEPDVYNKFYDAEGNNITPLVTNNDEIEFRHQREVKEEIISFPELYIILRKHVAEKYKTVDDCAFWDSAEVVNYIADYYKYNLKMETTFSAYYRGCGFRSLRKGHPFLWCVGSLSNGTYKDHVMAGCGYRIYSKTEGFWIFTHTSYKYFYELRDGHAKEARFFAFSGFWGFGGIGLFDISSYKKYIKDTGDAVL